MNSDEKTTKKIVVRKPLPEIELDDLDLVTGGEGEDVGLVGGGMSAVA